MAARSPSKPVRPRSPYSWFFLLGLVAITVGLGLLVMSLENKGLRPAGAVALLLGLIMAGSYLTNRLLTGTHDAPLAFDAPSGKLAKSAEPPRAAAPGKPVVAPGTHFPAAATASPPDLPQASVAAPPPPVPSVPSWPELFDHMSPQQFDAVCMALFAQSGFQTRCQSHGVAGGVTIWLHSRHAQQGKETPVAVALCKQWKGHEAGVRELHCLFELMQARKLKHGTYATASSYTDNARKFARYNGINALDKAGLLALIARRTAAQQQALLALAVEPD